jgi:hypothetical protein
MAKLAIQTTREERLASLIDGNFSMTDTFFRVWVGVKVHVLGPMWLLI